MARHSAERNARLSPHIFTILKNRDMWRPDSKKSHLFVFGHHLKKSNLHWIGTEDPYLSMETTPLTLPASGRGWGCGGCVAKGWAGLGWVAWRHGDRAIGFDQSSAFWKKSILLEPVVSVLEYIFKVSSINHVVGIGSKQYSAIRTIRIFNNT